jgi:hypothetical protein
MFTGLAWNGAPDAMTTPVQPHLAAALRLVSHKTVGAAFGATSTTTLHRATGHPLGKGHGFMPLARRQQQRQELASAFGPEVDFRTEVPLAAPERFGLRSPLLAQAAC